MLCVGQHAPKCQFGCLAFRTIESRPMVWRLENLRRKGRPDGRDWKGRDRNLSRFHHFENLVALIKASRVHLTAEINTFREVTLFWCFLDLHSMHYSDSLFLLFGPLFAIGVELVESLAHDAHSRARPL